MHDPAILFQFPADYAAAFAFAFLALFVVAVVAIITIAMRFGRLIALVERVARDGKETETRVSALRDRVIEIERETGRSPMHAVQRREDR